MLIFVVYVLVICIRISYFKLARQRKFKLERTVYAFCDCAEYLFKLGMRARTFLLVLVWHTFVQPLGRVHARAKESCIQLQVWQMLKKFG